MSIEKIVRIGGASLLLSLLIAAAIAGNQFNKVRFGGPVHHANQQISDLVADILPPPEYVIEAYLETTKLLQDPASLRERKARLAKLEADFRTREAFWRESDLNPDLKAHLLAGAVPQADRFWQAVNKGMLPALARGDMDQAQAAYRQAEQAYQAHRRQIDDLVSASTTAQAELAQKTEGVISRTLWLISALGLLIIGSTLACVLYVERAVIQPLRIIILRVNAMAAGNWDTATPGCDKANEMGDLSRAFNSFRDQLRSGAQEKAQQTDLIVSSIGEGLEQLAKNNLAYRISSELGGPFAKIGDDFNQAVASLDGIVSEVAGTSGKLGTSAGEIRSATDDLARRTERQASSLAETTSAMGQITTVIENTADQATHAQEIVALTRDEAEHSSEVVKRTVCAMSAIEESSGEIAQIVSLIDNIALQTNLLALNAGVEAARAGDAGKGFAVVASEVRLLALRSAEAAMDIRQRIGASSSLVEAGVSLVGQTGEALQRIIDRVGEIAEITTTIADAARGQAMTLRQVDGAVRDMDTVTQQNAAMVEQANAAVHDLVAHADHFRALVDCFTLVPTGARSPVPCVQARRAA